MMLDLGTPAIVWEASIDPVPLGRARVVFARSRTFAHMPERDVVYRNDLRVLWRAARLVRRPLQGDLIVAMTFAGRSRQRPDVSNLAKAVEDAGNGQLWDDDRQIRTLHVEIVDWGRGVRPLVRIEIWPYYGEAA